MKKLALAFVLLSSPALAQDRGPAPQTGMEHPEVLRGAKEDGAMATKMDKTKGTTGMNKRPRPEKGSSRK